jgi:Tol biopolymer transport system component
MSSISNFVKGRERKRVQGFGSAAVGLTLIVGTISAAATQLLTPPYPTDPISSGGNGNSLNASISPDGRYVVFSSSACDLVAGDDRQFNSDIFIRDRSLGITSIVSVNLAGTGGGNSHSTDPMISADDRFVIFQSDAGDLVTNDVNGDTDVFVRDLWGAVTTLVSVSTNGGSGNGASGSAFMTRDGRYVAFVSSSSNLVAGTTNGIANVFIRDLTTESTYLITGMARSIGPTIVVLMATPVITPDGRYVAYFSSAAGLVPGTPPGLPGGEIYVYDRQANLTTWVSSNTVSLVLATFGTRTNYASYHPFLSEDGRYVAFKAGSTNFGEPAMILQADLVAGTMAVISTNGVGSYPADEDRFGPEMSADGRFVAYSRSEPGGGNSLHVWDNQALTDVLGSDGGSGFQPGSSSHTAQFTHDGSELCFMSDATNLVANPVLSGQHIYLRDLASGALELVDVDTNGIGSSDVSGTMPSLSDDARLVAFNAPDGTLVPQDINGAQDVFVRDTLAGTNELVSVHAPGLVSGTGNGITRSMANPITADGRWVVFESTASDLIPGDTNGNCDVFVEDLATGSNSLVSVAADGGLAFGGPSGSATISGDGRYVVFTSAATNLVDSYAISNMNLFRRDLWTGTTELVSLGTNGLAADGECWSPMISSNGQFVVFTTSAKNLVGGLPAGFNYNTIWQDMNSGTRIPFATLTTFLTSMSMDGRFVSYAGTNDLKGGVRVMDTQSRSVVYSNAQSIQSAFLSPDGSRLLYFAQTSPYGIYVDDVIYGTNLFLLINGLGLSRPSAAWSADGRFVAFTASTNIISGGSNGTNTVYLYDCSFGNLSLVAVNYAHSGPGQAASDMPAVTGDGRYVVYRSLAPDLVPGKTGPSIYVFDRLTMVNSLLSPAGTDSGLFTWVSAPVVGSSASAVVFTSLGAGLVANDLNRLPDAFVAGLDSDGDGIPDWWMMKYFGHPTGQAGDLSLAGQDADGDGVSNLQEYLNGTNPTSALGDFVVQIFPILPGTSLATMMWPISVSGSFQVQYKDDLGSSAWLNLPGAPTIIANRAYFTVPVDQPQRLYRVAGTP